ncbi:hypothetical protein [Streptomyces sp. NPDC047968]|uniref:hypothetical protein n=1 Tax=unclassified Streptomyces TaxID=2593676 RepID=UPI0034232F2C
MDGHDPDPAVRRFGLLLLLAAVALVAVGALAGSRWLLGIGVWTLVGAGPVEVVYRP